MSASFEGKAIIVTGAASGMGRGVAELLARDRVPSGSLATSLFSRASE